jgi:hypothetical protein
MGSKNDRSAARETAHASVPIVDIRRAMAELSAALTAQERALGDQLLRPAQDLARGVVTRAEISVDTIADLIQRQRDLADQMAAWAEVQHQLADQLAAWAELQRQLAVAFGIWLAPASGAAKLTQRLIHQLDGRRPEDGDR